MEKYELLYILPAKHTEEEFKVLSEKIKGLVVEHGGEVTEEHHMGRRNLAYPINHVRYGNYFLIIFNAEQEIVRKLNDTFRLMSEVLRHLIVRRDPHIIGVPKLREEEQIVRKERTDRESAPRHRPTSETRPGPVGAEPNRPKDREGAAEGAAESADGEEEPKVTMEDLDERLDKILKDDLL